MNNVLRAEKLESLLNRVQKESEREEFIYGVTNRASRGIFERINDFFIDRSSIGIKEKAYFFELLSTMLGAGIPVNRALKILISRMENKRFRRVIATLSHEIEHGRPFSQALERFPDIFEETERGAIRSAEAVGRLENMLSKIAGNLERRHGLIMELTSALIYPAAVFGSLIIAVIIMLTFVVPRMEELFRESSTALPKVTRFLLGTSLWLSNYWWLLAMAIIFAVIIFHIYTRSENGRFAWDFRKLRIPFIGPILRKIFVMRFADTLGVLMESGLPINRSLEYVAASIGNEVYRVKTFEALGSVQEGKKLSHSLAQAPFLFPETVTNMMAVGEHAANLGEMCQKIGSHYMREIDHTLKNATTILGPLLILFIGATVAFFALAILSPIFSLTQTVL